MLLYGKRDSVSFSVNYALLPESTKAADVNETLVEDVNLYLFNELGDLVYYSYSEGSSTVETSVYENMDYSLYTLVNAHARIYVRSADELQTLRYSITDYPEMVSADGSVLMSGSLEAVRLSGRADVTVNLTRCVAKIVLKCDFSGLNPDVGIVADEVSLKNLPLSVKPFAQSKVDDRDDTSSSTIVENPSVETLQQGIVFYQYENMQGLLQEGNLDQTKKWWPEENPYSEICSYVEIKGHYSSSRKDGAITYRFYLGKDMVADYSVERNRQYTVVLCFNGDGAVEENTWRVDNSEIVDLVTSVELLPESHKFTEIGATLQLSATVQPLTAANKTLQWSTSDEKVATVDQSGKVTAIAGGQAKIKVSANGYDLYCTVTVVNPQIAFPASGRVMYNGETVTIPYSVLVPSDADVMIKPETSNVQIISSTPSGITVNAVAPGAVDTDMMNCYSEEEKAEICRDIPLGRMATADEIAKAIVFLLENGYVTGQVLTVDGGFAG